MSFNLSYAIAHAKIQILQKQGQDARIAIKPVVGNLAIGIKSRDGNIAQYLADQGHLSS